MVAKDKTKTAAVQPHACQRSLPEHTGGFLSLAKPLQLRKACFRNSKQGAPRGKGALHLQTTGA